jgi:hypothetical protein
MLNKIFDIMPTITICVYDNNNRIQWLIATHSPLQKKNPQSKI